MIVRVDACCLNRGVLSVTLFVGKIVFQLDIFDNRLFFIICSQLFSALNTFVSFEVFTLQTRATSHLNVFIIGINIKVPKKKGTDTKTSDFVTRYYILLVVILI